MKNKNFYIKRIKFIKNNNEYENLDNLWVICLESGDQMVKVSSYFNPVTLKDLESTLWHIKILNERKSTCDFYTKNVEYIQVPNEKIMIINNQEPIIYEETNSNNKIDIGNFEEILDFHKSVHPDNDDSEEITYDYGLFINVNENEESTSPLNINSFNDMNILLDKKLTPEEIANLTPFYQKIYLDNKNKLNLEEEELKDEKQTPVKNVNNEFKFIYNSFVEYDKVLMPRNPKNINGKDKFHEVKPYRCLDTKKWEIKSLVSNNDEDDEHSNLSSLFG
tara:strand:- start:1108 stop:1941 length:834 start_codon:yes stop_codon:yes gene_type:complete